MIFFQRRSLNEQEVPAGCVFLQKRVLPWDRFWQLSVSPRLGKRYAMTAPCSSFHCFQQFIEGAVWLSVDGVIDEKIFRYLYIIIAFLLWPVLAPFASAVAEKDPRWRTARYILFALGLMLGGYLAVKLARASDVEVK